MSITLVLIAINVLVFVAMAAGGVSPLEPTVKDLVRWGAGFGPLDLSTEWWRVFTAMFVHIGVLHILLNMYCLWSLGPLAERLFGPWRFLSLYLLSGVGGSIASVALHPMIVAAGASGAIFGVAGALLPVLHLRNIPAIVNLRGRRGRLGIGSFIVYNLVYGFANTGIDNAAHLGGLITGFVIGYAAPIAGSHQGRAAVLRTRVVQIAIAILLTLAFLGARRWRQSYADLALEYRARMSGDYAGARRPGRLVAGDSIWDVIGAAAPVAPERPEDVVRKMQAALREHPDDTLSLAALGSAFYELKRWPQAVDAFTRFTRIDSTSAAMWVNLGDAYLSWGHAADAVHPLLRATALVPADPTGHYLLGRAYLESKQYALAVAAFDSVLTLAPGWPVALEKRREAAHLLARVREQ